MAEEFAEFMEKLNNKSIEDQLVELKGVVVCMVDLVQKFIDNYTNELNTIHDKILFLETKKMIKKLPITETDKLTPVPSLNPARIVGRQNIRSTIIGELKEMFIKRNGVGRN